MVRIHVSQPIEIKRDFPIDGESLFHFRSFCPAPVPLYGFHHTKRPGIKPRIRCAQLNRHLRSDPWKSRNETLLGVGEDRLEKADEAYCVHLKPPIIVTYQVLS